MASFLIRQFAQRSFTRTAFQRAVSTPVVQELGKEKNSDDPLQHDDYFNVKSMVNLETLFK